MCYTWVKVTAWGVEMKNITFKKKKQFPKWGIALIVIGAVMLLLGGVLGGLAVSGVFGNKGGNEDIQKNYTFSTEGFENISDIKSLNGVMAVFTDAQSGKKGLMTFDGTVTENAEHNNFSVCSDVWRNYRYIVESPRSEYLLLADVESGTVTSRQYHGLKEPELIPCWSEAGKHLAWTNEKGYKGEVKPNELKLSNGFYPVANSLGEGAKYGFIGRNLQLEIALEFENAMDFSDDMAAVKKEGKWGYINKNGVKVIPCEFDSCASADAMGSDCAFAFTGGLAPVSKGGKFGIINKKAESVVDFVFDAILPGKNGVFIACKGGEWGIITIDEEYLSAVVPTTTLPVTTAGEPAIAQGKYMIKTSGSVLNMRAEADPNSNVIAKIPNGTVVNVSRSVMGWAYVKYNSYSGWVSADFLVKYVEPTTTKAPATQNSTNTAPTV